MNDMVELTCPLCGKPVRVPKIEIHTPFVCKKCHSPFHLNASKQAVLGDPPDVEEEFQALKQKLRQKVEEIPVKKVVAGLAGLFVVWLAWSFLFGPGQHLSQAAEAAAQALAENNPSYLKSIAAPGTADDVGRWFDEVYPRLVQSRKNWNSKEEAVEVSVVQEDPAQHKGAVGVSIHPIMGSARDVSLADPSAALAGAPVPLDVVLNWTLSRWGGWKLDGHETYAKIHPEP
jgi:hypothetical protein